MRIPLWIKSKSPLNKKKKKNLNQSKTAARLVKIGVSHSNSFRYYPVPNKRTRTTPNKFTPCIFWKFLTAYPCNPPPNFKSYFANVPVRLFGIGGLHQLQALEVVNVNSIMSVLRPLQINNFSSIGPPSPHLIAQNPPALS